MRNDFRPWAATVLSFVFAGLGHLYLGKYAKGLFFIFLEVVAYLGLSESYPDVFLIFTFALEVWVSFDAYRIALNQGKKEQVSNNELTIRTTITDGTDKDIKETNNKEKDIYV
jgi:TM2 domain-containing membrane protein YozV